MAIAKYRLELQLLKDLLRAAKKSKDPYSIANAYGILVDKIGKTHGNLLEEIKKIAKDLLVHIKRAASESNDPGRIGLAFGIVVDKRAFGEEKKTGEEKVKTSAERKKEYKELIENESVSKTKT